MAERVKRVFESVGFMSASSCEELPRPMLIDVDAKRKGNARRIGPNMEPWVAILLNGSSGGDVS
jgi:hypothetical protein